MILTFRPLKTRPPGWKTAEAARPPSPFDATYSATLELLDRELRHLDATAVFLQLDIDDADVRIDGQIRANANPNHPGVMLTIETRRHGVLVYDCDAFSRRYWRGNRPAWQDNLRAIALGLEALRRVERYGIAERGQQYAGFRELGAGMPMGSGKMSLDEAARLLADTACEAFGDDWVDAETLLAVGAPDHESLVRGAYRDAVQVHHPDRGGDPETFQRLTEARDLLLEAPR